MSENRSLLVAGMRCRQSIQTVQRPSRHVEIVESGTRQHYTLTAERD